ncbi:MAG: alpha/beta hydrolase-fold protein [Pseudomonadota bacterium]
MVQAESQTFAHAIESKYPEQTRTISVRVPASYSASSESSYPALYLLDAQSNLNYTVAVVDFLAANGLMPELIVVGLDAGATRSRDYLPENPELSAPISGDADQFMAYVERELIPFVESNYRMADYRILSGHSYGGVFVTHVMARQPELFQAYLTQSPFLDDAIGPAVIERLRASLHSGWQDDSPREAFYYLTWGNELNLETQINTFATLAQNDSHDSITWEFQHAPQQTHMTTRLLGQYHALAALFEQHWSLNPSTIAQGGASVVTAHLDMLSRRIGASVRWSDSQFQQAVQVAMSQQDLKSALQITERYIEHYPESPVAFLIQASLLGAGGNVEQALQAVNTGIDLYESNPRSELSEVYSQLRAMRNQLQG